MSSVAWNSPNGNSRLQTGVNIVSHDYGLAALSFKMADIGQQLFVLLATLKPAAANVVSGPANDSCAPSAASNAAPVVAMSYAGVAAKDMRQIIVATVNEIIKKQTN